MPDVQFSFEPGDIIGKVLAFGSPTPVEVAVQGPSLPANRAHAAKVYVELAKLTSLRDLQYKQSLDYPSIDVKVDRDRAGQYGLSAAGVAKSLVVATSSSRFVEPMYWRDPGNGNGFQIQVEIPQHRMKSMQDMADIPVMQNGAARPLLSDVAEIKPGTVMGEVERYDMQRVVSMTANIHGRPVGAIGPELEAAIRRAGEAPKGVTARFAVNSLRLRRPSIICRLACSSRSVRCSCCSPRTSSPFAWLWRFCSSFLLCCLAWDSHCCSPAQL
jgi:multidrug efflux pump subunit AcrB